MLFAGAVVFSAALARAQEAPRLTRPPTLAERVDAVYPRSALELGIEGVVELAVELDETGAVTTAEVISAPHEELAAAALVAVCASRFTPAEIDGRPAPIRFTYTYSFVMPRTARIEGQVRDAAGAEVQAFVEVRPGAARFETEPDGRFALEVPEEGVYTLIASHGALSSPPVTVELAIGDREAVVLVLPSSAARAEQPELRTEVRTKVDTPQIAEHTLGQDELRRVPGAFGDPLRAIETLPGIGRAPLSSGIIVMRGSSPDDSGVFIDGHRAPLLYHFGGGPSIVPMDAISAVRVHTGNFSARYGRATAGVVEVETRPGRDDELHGSAYVDVIGAGGGAEGPLGQRGSFRLFARRSYIDVLIPVVNASFGDRPTLTLAPRYYDYNARADYVPWQRLRLTLVAYGSDDSLAFADSDTERRIPKQLDLQISSHRVNPRAELTFGDRAKLEISPAFGIMRQTGETPEDFNDVRSMQWALRSQLSLELHPRARLITGIDATDDHYDFTARVDRSEFAVVFPRIGADWFDVNGAVDVLQTGAFVETDLRFGAWELVPGVRVDHARFSSTERWAVAPRFSARWHLVGDELVAKGGVGLYHRVPEPHEISDVSGNPHLALERSIQSSLGIELELPLALSVDVQGYYKRMAPLTGSAPALRLSEERVIPLRFHSDAEGRVVGGELLIMRRLANGVTGWLSYSLSRSERRNRGGEWQLYARDQTNNLAALASVDTVWDMRLGARVRYVTGYPYTPVIDSDFDADTARYSPETGEPQSHRLPAFFQLDLRAERLFGDREATHIIVYADVQNVTNHRNAEFFGYSDDFRERYAYPGLPILPSLGLEARF